VLTDLLLRHEIGTAKNFDVYVYSTVQEISNILSGAMAKVFSTDLNLTLTPQPPKVVHSYAGAVFEEFVMSAAADYDEMLFVESAFKVVSHNLKCMMYIIPYEGVEKILQHVDSKVA